MVCNKCGNEIPENARFCNRCGGGVQNAPEPKKKFPVVVVTVLVLFIGIGLAIYVTVNSVNNQTVVSTSTSANTSPPTEEPLSMKDLAEDFLSLPRDEQTEIFTRQIWGDELIAEVYTTGHLTATPWDNVSIENSLVDNLRKLEAFTYTVFDIAPEVVMDTPVYYVPIDDGVFIDIKANHHKFSKVQFRYPELENGNMNYILVMGFYNGQYFEREFDFGE